MKRILFVFPVLLVFALFSCTNDKTDSNQDETDTVADTTKAEKEWVMFFQDPSLDAFIKRGGQATYRVENGMLIGTTVKETPNTFMCTKKDYGDFELEFEVLVDTAINSGVQIRSQVFDKDTTITAIKPDGEEITRDLPADRVHGYQVEIDPSDRSWSAGIYDEARRGWLYNLEDKPQAREAFNKLDWNKYRIVAKGDTIRTWINGVPAAELVDSVDAKGLIGFQVHSIHSIEKYPWKEGAEVKWKNVRIRQLD